jgi:2-(1,2-epoxy-1,2-dihydrophenyl)acetyl-CoA isomerase
MAVAEPVLTDLRDGVLTLTLNRPDRMNALDRAAAGALCAALRAARDDDAVRAIVLTGAGRGFCAGAELGGGGEAQPPLTRAVRKSGISEFTEVAYALDRVDKPVVAAVNGAAVGAGLSYALACDRRFAAASARFAAIFVRRGLVPDCGISFYLPRLVGLSRAAHLLLTGEMIDAERALAMGLVDEVCPDEELQGRARAYAARLAAGASVAVELARRSVRRSFERDLEAAIDFESWAQSVAQRTEDVREGVQAFLEKREPRFQGR